MPLFAFVSSVVSIPAVLATPSPSALAISTSISKAAAAAAPVSATTAASFTFTPASVTTTTQQSAACALSTCSVTTIYPVACFVSCMVCTWLRCKAIMPLYDVERRSNTCVSRRGGMTSKRNRTVRSKASRNQTKQILERGIHTQQGRSKGARSQPLRRQTSC